MTSVGRREHDVEQDFGIPENTLVVILAVGKGAHGAKRRGQGLLRDRRRPSHQPLDRRLQAPPRMRRKDFREMLSREHRELVEASLATHADPTTYYPRGVEPAAIPCLTVEGAGLAEF